MRKPMLFMSAAQVSEGCCVRKSHSDVRCFIQRRKTFAQRLPNLVVDLVWRLRAIDQNDPLRFALSQFPVRFTNALVKFDRLLFHPVRSTWFWHSRLCRRWIDIEHKGDIGNGIAHRKSVQSLDNLSI